MSDQNTGGNEYLPWEDIYLKPAIPHPMGSRYPDFLLSEVLPFIKNKYRISTKREDIGLGGSSYGALIALYTYLEKLIVLVSYCWKAPLFMSMIRRYLKNLKLLRAYCLKRFPSGSEPMK